MRRFVGTAIGKSVYLATNVAGSGGQALPGLVVERLMPNYVADMLAKLPDGVIIVTGTNGKTTTTKIVVDLLRWSGKRVVTNATGSNMTRGIASGLIKNAKLTGKLPFDMAVLEVDEAYLKLLTDKIKPSWLLALNVSRDQLDRFGEVDRVAGLIGQAMKSATKGVVVNADDPELVKVAPKDAAYFGVTPNLHKFFPSDYELAAVDKPPKVINNRPTSAVELASFTDSSATYRLGSKTYEVKLSLRGQHNFQNAAAALALVKQVLPNLEDDKLVAQLANVSIAFGRGETYKLSSGATVELALVKNPAGFHQAIASYKNQKAQTMVAINDLLADGRDVSWLWDVDFTSLKIDITSGRRAADMALRLSYDDIKVDQVEPNLDKALQQLTATSGKKLIFVTYTAMTHLHKQLTNLSAGKS